MTEAEQALIGPLHEGHYRGHCLAGDDVHEGVMTFDEAKAYAAGHADVDGFTFEHQSREPAERVRVVFKSKMRVLYDEAWWSYSLGKAF